MLKILQIGAGSMGTRRLRDLYPKKEISLALFDQRDDRRIRARERFGIPVFSSLAEALAWEPEALIISTPPGTKQPFIQLALERGLHHFSEADIWAYNAVETERISKEKGLVSVPSASLLFLPVVKALGPLVREEIGKLISYQFYMATYMPQWHPSEGNEYYARHRDTAPAREMIPFELAHLSALFSPATEVAGDLAKYGALPAATEDTWSLSMRLRDGGIGQLAITMACPTNFRRGVCFGTQGMIIWDLEGGEITVLNNSGAPARHFHHGRMAEVLEPMYLEEITAFIDAIRGAKSWPQPYRLAQESCATVAAAEESSTTGRWAVVRPNQDPEVSPPARAL